MAKWRRTGHAAKLAAAKAELESLRETAGHLARETRKLADAAETVTTDVGSSSKALHGFVQLVRLRIGEAEYLKYNNLPSERGNRDRRYQRWFEVARFIVSPEYQSTESQVTEQYPTISEAAAGIRSTLSTFRAADRKLTPKDTLARRAVKALLARIEDEEFVKLVPNARNILIRWLTGEITTEQAVEVAGGATVEHGDGVAQPEPQRPTVREALR